MLVLSRFLGGIASGNLQQRWLQPSMLFRKDRSKGMALIGIAFGLGFMLGPLSTWGNRL